MSEIKFLGDGDAVLVVGEAPALNTSTDGGRTLEEVPQSYVARLAIEAVDNDQLLDERPEIDVATGSPVVAADAQPAGPEAAATPARGDAQNADELQAEIDALRAERDELRAREGGQVPSGTPPTATTEPGPAGA